MLNVSEFANSENSAVNVQGNTCPTKLVPEHVIEFVVFDVILIRFKFFSPDEK